MPRPFSPATAEQVVAAVDAVFVSGREADAVFVAAFSDITEDRARAALELAVDLQLLMKAGNAFRSASPLCRILVSPKEAHRAAALRVALESYEPFIVFRTRLPATPIAATAAHQTKVALDLSAHRDEIKDTLVSLGTYSQALLEEGGGLYRIADPTAENHLVSLAQGIEDSARAEGRIREQLGSHATASVSRDDVILPLTEALQKAIGGDPDGAIQCAGNAVESYLVALAGRRGVTLAGATGLNAKVDRLIHSNDVPKKIGYVGKYLGHLRNAADHGIDPEVNASWTIRENTGVEYVYVACSFIAACDVRERGGPFEL